jgi:nicotinamide mononucleotide (NMN) deamidase PncC
MIGFCFHPRPGQSAIFKDVFICFSHAASFYMLGVAAPASFLVGVRAGAISFRCSTTIQRTAVAKANPLSCAYFSTSVVAQGGNLIKLVLYSIDSFIYF